MWAAASFSLHPASSVTVQVTLLLLASEPSKLLITQLEGALSWPLITSPRAFNGENHVPACNWFLVYVLEHTCLSAPAARRIDDASVYWCVVLRNQRNLSKKKKISVVLFWWKLPQSFITGTETVFTSGGKSPLVPVLYSGASIRDYLVPGQEPELKRDL